MIDNEVLRDALADALADARCGPDPYLRLVRRAKARRRTRVAAGAGVVTAAAAAFALVTVPLGGPVKPASPVDDRPAATRGSPITSDWSRRLLASPPRGSLSGDGAYVRAVASAVARHRGKVEVSRDLDQVIVLFVGDVGTTRVALVALSDGDSAVAVWYAAPVGASLDRLASEPVSVSDGPKPFERIAYHARPYQNTQDLSFMVGVVPAGCVIDTATDPDHQNWQRTAGDSFVALPTAYADGWWRITCDGTVHYDGPAGIANNLAVITLPRVSDTQLDAALADARGTVDREAALNTVRSLLRPQTAPAGDPRVLWGGAEPGSAQQVTVAAVPVAGGWTVMMNRSTGVPAQSSAELFVTITGIDLGDPAALYALRVNDATDTPDRVLVLAPREAVTAVTVDPDGRELGRVTLSEGVGWTTAPPASTVRALDATGSTLGTYRLDSAEKHETARTVETW